MNRPFVALCAIMIIGLGASRAQSVITSFGGDVKASTGIVSFTLGQTADRADIDTAVTVNIRTATLTEGVQQPYLTIEQLAINEVEGVHVAVEVYPNPNLGEFQISVDDESLKVNYELFNAAGQKIADGEFRSKTHIDIHKYASGGYLLHVRSTDGRIDNSYRVVKGH